MSTIPPGPRSVKSPSLILINRSEFIIDELMPTREVHIIAGPSGAGKTTFLFQMLSDIQAGVPVFGYPTHPVPIAYIACDRSLAGIHRTLERIGLTPAFPVYSLFTSPEFKLPSHRTPMGMLSQLKSLHPEVQLIVVDAIGLLLDDGHGYGKTGSFITSMVEMCTANNQTIWGIHHSPKQKTDSKYASARQRLSGFTSWAGCASLIVLVEPAEEGDVNNRDRNVIVLPRDAPEVSLSYTTDLDGRIIPVTPDPPKKKGQLQAEFDALLEKIPVGFVSMTQIREILHSIKAGERWGRKLINRHVDAGDIIRIDNGAYQKLYSPLSQTEVVPQAKEE
jgi:hypothetical protein